MGEQRSVHDIERDIEVHRERLVGDIQSLQIRVRAELDWRQRVRTRPAPYLGALFAIGLLIGWRA